jgi:hypothetical protein
VTHQPFFRCIIVRIKEIICSPGESCFKKSKKMKNVIKLLALCFFAIGITMLTSCGKDDVVDVEKSLCDSTLTTITVIGDSLDLTLTAENFGGTAPFTYLWSNGATTQSITVEPEEGATYSVTVTDAEDCETEATYTYENNNTNACDNFSTTIYLNSDSLNNGQDFLNAISSGGTSPHTYLWSTGETSGAIEVTGASGTFSVTVTDANGCTAVDTYTLNGGTDPCANFYTNIYFYQDSVVAGQDLLTAVGIGGTFPITYLWSTGSTSGAIDVTGASGTFSVTVTDANGCTAEDSYTLSGSNPCANFYAGIFYNPDSLGMGQDYLNALAFNGTFPYTYLWSTGETTGAIEVTGASGTFVVTVTDANGCTDEDDYEL